MSQRPKTMLEVQIEHFNRAMQQCNGNRVKMADSLGISLKTVYNWIERIAGLKTKGKLNRIKEIRCKDYPKNRRGRRAAGTAGETK